MEINYFPVSAMFFLPQGSIFVINVENTTALYRAARLVSMYIDRPKG